MAHWIAALHKKKFVFDATNYCGVHITFQMSKVIECVLGIHLFPVMIERAFGEYQYAYLPQRGGRDAVLPYVATWLKMLNDCKKTQVYCSDVSGAFDRVCSARLLAKISFAGFTQRPVLAQRKAGFVNDRHSSL